MKDFFKIRAFGEISEEGGAGETGTPSLVAKYKAGTPGQTGSAPSKQQPARKGDKLNAKDEPGRQGVSESKAVRDIAAAAERRAGSVMKPKQKPKPSSTKSSLAGIAAAAAKRLTK